MRALMMLGLMSCLLMPSFSIADGGDGGPDGSEPQSGGDSTLGNTENNPLDESVGTDTESPQPGTGAGSDDSSQGSDGDESNDEPAAA